MRKCVIFLHIPKTAGLSLGVVLGRQYSSLVRIDTLDRPPHFVPEASDALSKADLITGHLHYGIHQRIPRECVYVTLLREPVARVVSLYNYIRRSPDHELHPEASSMSLQRFVTSGVYAHQVENGQTRLVAGLRSGEPNDESLRLACEHLSDFLAVGLAERFDESLALFRRHLEWRIPFYVPQNVAPRLTNERSLPEETVNLIREHNRLDLQLYEFGAQLFSDQLGRLGRAIELDLVAFRALNRMYGIVRTNEALYKLARTIPRPRRR